MSFLIYLLISQMKVTDFSVKVMSTKMAEKQVLAYLGIAFNFVGYQKHSYGHLFGIDLFCFSFFLLPGVGGGKTANTLA